MIRAEWQGNKLLGNGVTIAEVKPCMTDTYKVMYADRTDFGPNSFGYPSVDAAKGACETKFGIVK